MNALRTWYGTAKLVVRSPNRFFRVMPPERNLSPLIRFATISLVIAGILSGIVTLLWSGAAGRLTTSVLLTPLKDAVIGVLGGTLGILFFSGLVHAVVYLLGGRNYLKTLHVTAHATAVLTFFGWIPFLNVLAGLYALYVETVGIKYMHELSTLRAVLTVLIPVVLILVAAIGVLLWAFSTAEILPT